MKAVFDEPDESMEMPTPCTHCGRWFDLLDGASSDKWYPNTVICEECAGEEAAEIERDGEIEDLKNELADAQWTVDNCKKRLKELGVNIDNP